MFTEEHLSFGRYLSVKKSIDDRALNRAVWNQLWTILHRPDKNRPLRILELGSGIGTMAERMVESGRLTYADYTAVEIEAELITESRQRLINRAEREGLELQWHSKDTAWIQKETDEFTFKFIQSNIYDFFKNVDLSEKWDLGLAHAFMDLVNTEDVLPQFCAIIKPGGFLYLTLNYDGETILLPTLDPDLDGHIMSLYNQSMDERTIDGRKTGDSRTGRHLFDHLKIVNAQLLAAGSSDWVVFPGIKGYSPDESYFLQFIIHTIHAELKDHRLLNTSDFESWIQQRYSQIHNGELIFVAKQLDFLARIPQKKGNALT